MDVALLNSAFDEEESDVDVAGSGSCQLVSIPLQLGTDWYRFARPIQWQSQNLLRESCRIDHGTQSALASKL